MYRITLFPANDGDCILVETGNAASPHRLLIDGGRRATYKNHLAEILSSSAGDRPAIDLLVLTHVDADHIEGLLKLTATEVSSRVGEVWFNGGRQMHIAKFGTSPCEKAEDAKVLSAEQGVFFERRLITGKWNWNSSFDGDPIMINDAAELPQIKLSSGAVLTLLGPPKKKLADFFDTWEEAFRELKERPEKTLGGEPFPALHPGSLEQLAKSRDTADAAPANGTSIAFAVSADNKCCLFCADAHPGDIVNALNRFAPGQNPVRFDAVKASHHGSAANNINLLVNRLHSYTWLISTNGAYHQHPNPEAISRIVLAEPRGKRIVFNYRKPQTEPWAAGPLQDHYKFLTCFPEKNGQPICIELA